jgi:hypothetical protein
MVRVTFPTAITMVLGAQNAKASVMRIRSAVDIQPAYVAIVTIVSYGWLLR